MEIQMSIDVIEVPDELEMLLHLCPQLSLQFGSQVLVEEPAQAGQHGVIRKPPERVDGRSNFRRREHAAASAHDRVQTNIELGMLVRQRNRFITVRLRDHEARTGQNTLAMGPDHGSVNLARQAEVVGIYD